MLTELGKELRRLRIDQEEKMLDMADKIGRSPAFISSVETGKKAPPAGFEDLIISAYRLASDAANKLRAAADRSRKAFILEPRSLLGKDTASLMARRMNELSEEELEAIRKILNHGSKIDGQ